MLQALKDIETHAKDMALKFAAGVADIEHEFAGLFEKIEYAIGRHTAATEGDGAGEVHVMSVDGTVTTLDADGAVTSVEAPAAEPVAAAPAEPIQAPAEAAQPSSDPAPAA